MTDGKTFSGFPEAGLRFLEELAANNNKEWFDAHKKDYNKLVRDPSVALVIAIGERLQSISPNIRYDPRTNGSGSLLRINRDVRFSEDKSPYKTKIAMMFWEGDGKKMEHPGFGMQIETTGAGLMAGKFNFDKSMLPVYREAVLDDVLGVQLVNAVQKVKSAGDYEVGGEHYKRVPRGYSDDHERADWLRYAGLWASSPEIDLNTVMSPAFVEVVFNHFRNMAPIQQWLVQINPV
jgi:uncharacterized protein (TIGR02453 family)